MRRHLLHHSNECIPRAQITAATPSALQLPLVGFALSPDVTAMAKARKPRTPPAPHTTPPRARTACTAAAHVCSRGERPAAWTAGDLSSVWAAPLTTRRPPLSRHTPSSSRTATARAARLSPPPRRGPGCRRRRPEPHPTAGGPEPGLCRLPGEALHCFPYSAPCLRRIMVSALKTKRRRMPCPGLACAVPWLRRRRRSPPASLEPC